MFKKCFIIAMTLSLASCEFLRAWWGGSEEELCPVVKIDPQNLYIKDSESGNSFRVSIRGFEGYCYTDAHNINRAVIVPIIRVQRLKDTGETDIHFTYYTETLEGPPEFLGKKTYHTYLSVSLQEPGMVFRLKPLERVIPTEAPHDYDIKLGLDKSF